MSAERDGDDVLRAYLLGRAAPATRESLEQRLFSDDDAFWERLCLVEDELVDRYVSGELDGEETTSFERHFLVTGERRARLELSRALFEYAQARKGQRGSRGWLGRPLSFPAWTIAAAAALVLAVPAVVWHGATRGPVGDTSAWLSAGLVRDVEGELARVALPEGCQLVRLHLDAGHWEHATYRATLHDVDGGPLWAQDRLAPAPVEGRRAVTLTLPCDLLPPEDYYVRLEGVTAGAPPAPLGRYDFRVLR
jgi:hypothetical protein